MTATIHIYSLGERLGKISVSNLDAQDEEKVRKFLRERISVGVGTYDIERIEPRGANECAAFFVKKTARKKAS